MRPAVPFLELYTQYRQVKTEIDRAIQDVLDCGVFVFGGQVAAFEKEFAAYLGVPHAVGVSSGTDALRLALLGAGVGPGDEVITSALTAVATVVAIEGTGARAILADIDPETYTLDASQVKSRLTPRTKAIVPSTSMATLPISSLCSRLRTTEGSKSSRTPARRMARRTRARR